MAITGTGTQADPWVVTTYAELVDKADDEGYIKIGNDINILEEYPDGDMPTLEIVKSDIDGNNKVISNWYKRTSGYCIETTDSSDTVSCIHDLLILNIYTVDSATAFIKRGDSDDRPFFVGCGLSGKLSTPIAHDGNILRYKDCALTCDLKSNRPSDNIASYFDNCYVILTSMYSGSIFYDYGLSAVAKDSYFEMSLPNSGGMAGYGGGFDNCVLDVTTNNTFYAGGGNHGVSIINTTHAPNAVPDGTNVKGVSDANWLDAAYLSSIGFNIG